MSTSNPIETLAHSLESASVLDPPGKAIGSQVRSLVPSGPVKDALSGTWLGHALHPLLTDVVIGSFTSATLLDVVGGVEAETASQRLIALGIASYPVTALTGINDWADSEPADDTVRRTGLIHAGTNAVALGLYSASLLARRNGSRGKGIALSLAGMSVLGFGGWLGGHLSYRQGVGVDQTVFDPGSSEWQRAADASQLSEGQPTRVVVEDTPVLLLRDGGQIFALHDRCSHRGCSLSEGEVEGDEIVCGCHGSRFDRRDGSVRQGPATAPQPAYQTREREGIVEIRLIA